MNSDDLKAIEDKLQRLTDAELASLIIEFVSSDSIASLLGEETLRRLTRLRFKDTLGRSAPWLRTAKGFSS